MGSCISILKPIEVIAIDEVKHLILNEVKTELINKIIPDLIIQLNMTEDKISQ